MHTHWKHVSKTWFATNNASVYSLFYAGKFGSDECLVRVCVCASIMAISYEGSQIITQLLPLHHFRQVQQSSHSKETCQFPLSTGYLKVPTPSLRLLTAISNSIIYTFSANNNAEKLAINCITSRKEDAVVFVLSFYSKYQVEDDDDDDDDSVVGFIGMCVCIYEWTIRFPASALEVQQQKEV